MRFLRAVVGCLPLAAVGAPILQAQTVGRSQYRDPLLDPAVQAVMRQAQEPVDKPTRATPSRAPRWTARLPGHKCGGPIHDEQGRVLLERQTRPDGTVVEKEYKPAGQLFSVVHHGPKGLLEVARYCGPTCGTRSKVLIVENGWPTPWAHATLVEAERGRPGRRPESPQIMTTGATSAIRSAATLAPSERSYQYDPNGNLIGDSEGTSYQYDLENRLTKVTKADGTVVDHVYDFDGNRVRTTTSQPGQPAQTVDFLVDTAGDVAHVVAETDGTTGALLSSYTRGASGELLSVLRPDGSGGFTTRYVHSDALGSVRRLTDEGGLITDGFSYTAFGELLSHTGSDQQPYAFAGEPLDASTGLQYHRARWMDPATNRFLGMDPLVGSAVQPITLHRFLYAGADPVDNIDPTGEFTVAEGLTSLAMLNTINATSTPSFGLFAAAASGPRELQVTIDDSPLGGLTSVLDVLRRHSVKTMFFVVGAHIDGRGAAGGERTLRSILDGGHQLGNHTWNHIDLTGQRVNVGEELNRTDRLVRRLVGYDMAPHWRAPGLSLNSGVLQAAGRVGYGQHEGVDLDPRDWESSVRGNRELLLRRVREAMIRNPGGRQILFHDRDPAHSAAIDYVIATLKREGHRFVDFRR
jgi:RHS repeat-associated protein